MSKPVKTNAMRLLDQAAIAYTIMNYEYDEADLSGVKAAQALGLPPAQVYKTLVARGDKTGYLVCCLAVDCEVDLKELSRISGDKRVELIPTRDLLPLTGYIRGGCSPLAMKKRWPTWVDAAVLEQERVAVSAGQRGVQMLLAPDDLIRATGARTGLLARVGIF
jgi:Cys-tRNA(Pro)/Cys-tRNA(Cys) deacylase